MNMMPLGEMVEFRGGGTPSKDEPAYWGGGIPWATVKDFKSTALSSTIDDISSEGLSNSSARLIPAGSVIIPTRMALGKAAINTIDLAINQDLRWLVPKVELDARYLLHAIIGNAEKIERMGSGATVKGITQSNLAKILVSCPPLPEQKRIAAILDKADELRAKRREAIAELDKLIQATCLDMFGDPVTNPKGWETKSLGNVCDVRDGTHDSPKYVNDGYPLLTSKNFKSGYIDLEGANLISEADYEAINRRSKVDLGDLVMPMIGSIGNPVLVSQEPDFAIKNVALIKFGHNSPNNQYVKSLLCSHYFDHVTSKLNRGGTQKFVALKDLRGMSIPVPPDAEQKRYAAIVDSIESHRHVLARYLSDLNELFDSLQNRAFNGDL